MRLPKPMVKRCVLCGSARNVQGNHLGGRQFLACFTMPFCDRCHPLFHAMVDRAGIDLRYTDEPIERIRRALAAIKIAEWMLLEQLKNTLFKAKEQDDEVSKKQDDEDSKKHDNSSPPNN